MTIQTVPNWPLIVMAVIMGADALLCFWPPAFVRVCLNSVQFPEHYWWAIGYTKLVATIGLVAGLSLPGIGLASLAGCVSYFVAATIAHLKTNSAHGQAWLTCLTLLGISTICLIVGLLPTIQTI